MTSRREQLDAHLFGRRRIVAALLVGSTSDRCAPRPLRAVLPGVVAGAVLLAGSAVFGMVRPGTPPGWRTPGTLVVARESAGRYVHLEGRLHPVLNTASARLLLDPGRFRVTIVPDRSLDREPRGPVLGIPGAPDRLPVPRRLRDPQVWTACAHAGPAPDSPPIRLMIRPEPDERLLGRDDAFFVRSSGADHLVVGGRRHLLRVPSVRTALGLDAREPVPVPESWLTLLEDGGELAHPDIPGRGEPGRVTGGLPPPLRAIGTVVRVRVGPHGQHYVVTGDGVVPVTALGALLILTDPAARADPEAARQGEAAPVGAGELGDAVRTGGTSPGLPTWPERPPVPVNFADGASLCSTYVPGAGGTHGHLVHSVRPPGSGHDPGNGPGITLRPGGGALYREVTGGPDDPTGPVFLVTDTGRRHLLAPASDGGPDDARTRLGYRDLQPFPLPRAWSVLVPPGPVLDLQQVTVPQSP